MKKMLHPREMQDPWKFATTYEPTDPDQQYPKVQMAFNFSDRWITLIVDPSAQDMNSFMTEVPIIWKPVY